ncbi:MAG: DUF87 domain-containing protein, partial [Parvibaculum sp.]|nr:DUF87 domain-containing protein [Parvibaculum sp.]
MSVPVPASAPPAAATPGVSADPEAPPFVERRGAPASPPFRIAHIVSVSGSQAIAVLERDQMPGAEPTRVEIGQLVKIPTPAATVVGIVSAVSAPSPATGGSEDIGLIEINLAGEIVSDPGDGRLSFRRGVANLPTLGDAVLLADRHDLTRVYTQPNVATIEVGSLYQDASVPARFLTDDLLAKHFIVVGTTGCGKSCALTAILQRVLMQHDHAHIV